MVLLNDCFLSLEPIKIMPQISIHAHVFLFLYASGWSHPWENQKAGAEETQPPLPSPLYVQLSGASRGFLHLSSTLRSRKPLDLRADLSIGLIPPLGDQGSMWSLRNAWDWSAPLPHHCMLGWVGHCSHGGPRKNRGVVPGLPQVLSYLSLFQLRLTTWSSFFIATLHPMWLRNQESEKFLLSRKSTVKNTGTISGVHWTPGDHLSKQCFLYHNKLLCRQVGSKGGGENWINKSRRRQNNEAEMRVVSGKKLIYIAHHASLKPLFDPCWS